MQIRKNLLIILKLKTKNEEELWAMEKWKSKIRIPTFPPPRMPAAQGKNGRLHKTLDPSEPLKSRPRRRDSHIPTAPATQADGKVENQTQVFHFPTASIPLLSERTRPRRSRASPSAWRRSAPLVVPFCSGAVGNFHSALDSRRGVNEKLLPLPQSGQGQRPRLHALRTLDTDNPFRRLINERARHCWQEPSNVSLRKRDHFRSAGLDRPHGPGGGPGRGLHAGAGACVSAQIPNAVPNSNAARRAGAAQWKVAMSTPVDRRLPASYTGTPAANDATRGAHARRYTPTAVAAGNDAPLIGERAATRGRSATEGGDERVGVERALSVQTPATRTRSKRREP